MKKEAIIKRKLIYGMYTDKGIRKAVNEDSVLFLHVEIKRGEAVFACVCDGMGGLAKGEIASGYVCEEWNKWFLSNGIVLLGQPAIGRKRRIKKSGFRLCQRMNEELLRYQKQKGVVLGTTATAVLFFKGKYYLFHIGDSMAFLYHKKSKKLTKDHAKNRYTLTRCVGVSKEYKPDFKVGNIKKNSGVLLCSDGFLQKFLEDEIRSGLMQKNVRTEEKIEKCLREIAQRSIERGENDNISALFFKVM